MIFKSDVDKVSIAMKRRTAPALVRAAYASRTVVPEGAVILTFRDSEIYLYGNHRTLSHFDPQAWEIYDAKDVSAVETILKAKGIRYFYMPSHSNVTLSGNALDQLLGDPSKVRIVYQDWASLLEYVPEGLPVDRHAILRWKAETPLALSRSHWSFIPPQIGECKAYAMYYRHLLRRTSRAGERAQSRRAVPTCTMMLVGLCLRVKATSFSFGWDWDWNGQDAYW